MVKSAKSHLVDEEEEEEDEEEYNSSSYKVKGGGKSGEQKSNAYRSKHSETEQRRRSKINERFQILRDIIPQNDQRRDKASFLLEVIEYIHFLQEKLHLYEGSFQGWSQEPTKLIPWRNHHAPTESFVDHPQVLNNGSGTENNVVTPAMSVVYKGLDRPPGSTTPVAALNMQTQSDTFAPAGTCAIPPQLLQEFVTDAENLTYQMQSQLWPAKPHATPDAVRNNRLDDEDLTTENGSDSVSNTYSQGILNTLTQVFQSSGVDMSQTSISVQIDVGKQANSSQSTISSSSRDHKKQYLNNQVMVQTGLQSCVENSDQAHKRLKTERS
ncbi:HLH domain-containing protein [Cephalotus follicularis]|uniref:HLH domain-containing protein n=1 Tax=Cephalotus follicularis TaxID=3775 RepID=A0A1Q3AWJ5_CEPFO|nr:HLH domain-containing protein [Cephalotus follicularis]